MTSDSAASLPQQLRADADEQEALSADLFSMRVSMSLPKRERDSEDMCKEHATHMRSAADALERAERQLSEADDVIHFLAADNRWMAHGTLRLALIDEALKRHASRGRPTSTQEEHGR